MSDATPRGLSHWEGEPIRVWTSLWGIPELEAHDSLPSTNDRCRELAQAGRKAFTTVIADEQTAGRGRSGRTWVSPAGLGLWMSTLIVAPGQAGSPLAPLLLGLAVVRGVTDVAPETRAALKWPNDVHVGGRKLCGILCEASGTGGGVIAGIGLNVSQRPGDFPQELKDRAVSLAMAAGRGVSRTALAGRILHHVKALMTPPPVRLEGPIARAIATLDVLAGRQVEVSTGVRGRGRGITPEGALLVEEPNGRTHEIYAGTVRPIVSGAGGASSPHPDGG